MTGEKALFPYNKERAAVAKRIAITWSAIHTSQPVRLNPIGLYSFFDNIVLFNPNSPKDMANMGTMIKQQRLSRFT